MVTGALQHGSNIVEDIVERVVRAAAAISATLTCVAETVVAELVECSGGVIEDSRGIRKNVRVAERIASPDRAPSVTDPV